MTDPVLLPRPRQADWSGQRVEPGSLVERRDPTLPAQGYRLTITANGTTIEAADDAGAFYGRATLDQLAASGADDGRLPIGVVEDHPDLRVRGVMLDVSRDKVPTVETLEALIARLAAWKINHVELYMEHTFAYVAHEEVWADASPYTAADIARLDKFCRDRHVELTPNQNCLGHFERWLAHDRYRPLAIRPDGWTDGRGRHRPPTTLEPTNPAARALVAELLAELLDAFSSPRVHLGLDEPWELPDERFDDYVDYVAHLRGLEVLEGRELLMWGDIVASHPDRLIDLPEGVTVCEWGYEADHPFATRASRLDESTKPFWLCPGTSSWNSIVGRSTNAEANINGAVSAAVDHGAEGLLVTDWGDNGHLQYLPMSEPAFAIAAARAWCAAANDGDLAPEISLHVFDDPSGRFEQALRTLGDAHRLVVPQLANTSILTAHLYSPRLRMGEGFTDGLRDEDLGRAAGVVADARASSAAHESGRSDAALVADEVDLAARLMDLLIRDARARLAAGGTLDAVVAVERGALAEELAGIEAEHRGRWLARNRPGGLDDSCGRLRRLRQAYSA